MLFDTGHQHTRPGPGAGTYPCGYTCTPTHTYTNGTARRGTGVLLTPKSLDLFLAFLFSPKHGHPGSALARLGPVPETAWKQETKDCSGQLGRDTDGLSGFQELARSA